MPWGGQTWLRATKEVDYGVRNPSPDPDADVLWFRLYSDNSFTMRPAPQRQIIRSADAGNRRRQVVAARKSYQGSLATLCYPSQCAYLFEAAAMSGNDLPSYTLDHFDSTRIQGYLGAKLQSLGMTSSATQDYTTLNLGWIAQRRDDTFTVLPQPADSVFPDEVPYEHVECGGQVTVGGSIATKYSSLSLSISNILQGTWDELPYISNLYYCGRDVGFTLNPQYIDAQFREDFEDQTPLTCSLIWARSSPVSSLSIDCKTKVYTGNVSDQIPLGGPAYQTVSFESFFDGSATTDMSISVISPP